MKTKEYKTMQILANTVLIICSLIVVLPFLLLIIASFTDNAWAMANGFQFFPKKFSLEAYKYILVQFGTIGRAYIMTIIVTAIGTGVSVIITSLFAYAISQEDIPAMKVFSFMTVFTMLFNGGLVATYYSYVNYFHIKNTIFALIIPNLLMNAFNVILVRNYVRSGIPVSLIEAAHLDGANPFQVYGKIIMPLSKPILATIGLMTGLSYWNDWQNGLYYLTERGGSHLYTIQVILNNINENIKILQQTASATIGSVPMPSTTIRMAIAVVGILPILIIYPFFQQYFVKGIMLGGVKE